MIRTITVGPRLVQAILVLPEVLHRLEEIERQTQVMVGNTGSMERSTALLAAQVPEMERSLQRLTDATQPLGRLAGRLPGGRRGEALP